MNARRFFIFGSFILLILLGAIYWNSFSASAECSFSEHSLLGASRKTIAQAAINFTCLRYSSSSKPRAIVVRPTTFSDLEELDVPPETICQNRERYLVVLEGDFRENQQSQEPQITYRYIAYVFDLPTGFPMLIQTSRKGGPFRKILNDPSLPDDPILSPSLSSPKGKPIPQPTRDQSTCGDANPAPTLMPPK